MTVKHFIALLIIIIPTFLVAQTNSATQDSTNRRLSASKLRRLHAQERRAKIDKIIAQEEEGALVFQKQWAIGIKLNTDGESIFYEHGKYKTIQRSNLWWIEMGEKKARNQTKTTPQPTVTTYPGFSLISVGNDFVFGKENNFYHIKLGLGRQLRIGSKGTNNGVAVSAIVGGGLSLGLLKPYYLQVLDSTSSTGIKDIKYDNDPSTFLDPNSIVGASGFSKGIYSTTVIPGLHVRGSLRFDYGRYRETLSAIEVGFNADYYAKKITIMAQNPKENLFVNAYIGIVFGGRH